MNLVILTRIIFLIPLISFPVYLLIDIIKSFTIPHFDLSAKKPYTVTSLNRLSTIVDLICVGLSIMLLSLFYGKESIFFSNKVFDLSNITDISILATIGIMLLVRVIIALPVYNIWKEIIESEEQKK